MSFLKGSGLAKTLGPVHALAPARARNAPSLEDLYRAHAVRVARWAAKCAGPESDLEDIVHEVFLVVHEKLDDFRGDAPITTWLYRITENVARKHRRQRLGLESLSEDDPPRCPAPDPEHAAERAEVRAAVRGTLEQMPAHFREVLVLADIERYSAKEIAERVGTSPSNVWVRVHRARRHFMQRFSRRHVGLDPLVALLFALLLLSAGASAIAHWAQQHKSAHKPARSIRYRPASLGLSQLSPSRSLEYASEPNAPEEDFMIKRIVPAAVAAAWLGPTALAQAEPERPPETRIVYSQKTIVHFDGSKVDGESVKPDGVFIHGKPPVKFGLLVRVRADFRPELLRSIDQL